MTGSKPVPLDVVLQNYLQSDEHVRALKSRLPRSDVDTIIKEVLDRVRTETLRNHTSIDSPSPRKVEQLCHALIAEDSQEGQRFIERVYDAGASLDAIYLNYLAEAAAVLGEWWEEDAVSFHEVAIGSSRIYAIVRGLSYLFVPTRPVEVKSAVFALVPNETHTLGIRMAADLFGKEGWDVHLLVGKDHDGLMTEISQSLAPLIGLSAAGGHSFAALARLIVAIRISNPFAAIVLSGQIVHEEPEMIAALGVDGVVADVTEAVQIFDDLHAGVARAYR